MQEARDILKAVYGYDEFRDGQEDIIDAVLTGKRTLGIMPTGGGKSLTYQIPSLLLSGITVVVSPLISLMKNQVDELITMGIDATMINSSLDYQDLRERMMALEQGVFKLVFIAPERLEDPNFYHVLQTLPINLVVIDEAHVLSQWGHNFRPSYLRAVGLIESLASNPCVMALTATATEQVQRDLEQQLRIDQTVKTGFARDNVTLKIEKGLSDKQKMTFVERYVNDHPNEVGIIYAGTRKKVDEVTAYLQTNKVNACRYHAGMSDNARSQAQDQFLYDQVDVIVATNAFGMGINKTNVRYVLHYAMPGSIEAYYQEIGRAGRDGLPSEAVLLFSPADIRLQRFFIANGDNQDAGYLANEYRKVQEMANFGATQLCLPQYILQYFGEKSESCDRCSNCTDTRQLVDITEEAQKILSNVYYMTKNGRTAGKTTIVQVLRGKLADNMRWTKFDQLSTYGLMKQRTIKSLNALVDELTADGYLDIVGAYNSLAVSSLGVQVLKGKIAVQHRQTEIDRTKQRLHKAVGGPLFEKLREKRLELAREMGKPPYIIFSDQTLMALSTNKPRNRQELLEISGIGNVKADQYGDIFLALINENNDN